MHKKLQNNLMKIEDFLKNQYVDVFLIILIVCPFCWNYADPVILKKFTFFIFVGSLIYLFSLCIAKGRRVFLLAAFAVLEIGILFWNPEETLCVLKKMPPESIGTIRVTIRVNQNPISRKVTAYILNLDRAKERWEFIRPQVEQLGIPYERISAVEGKKIPESLLANLVDKETVCGFFKKLPEKGTIGCSMSHEKTWRMFLESDSEFALIFEDDVQFDPKILSDIVSDLIDKKDLWDIAALELNHNGCPFKISQLSHEKSLVFYMTNVKDSGAYLINRATAKKLLERFFPIKMPLDHYFTRSWEFGIKFCGVEPRIAAQRFGDSQIKCEPTNSKKTLKTVTINVLYNIYTAFMGSVYNFFLWLSHRW